MKIVTIIGARPQFIKAAAVSRAIAFHNKNVSSESDCIEEVIVHSGQHYDANMSQVFFEELEIPEPHVNLGIVMYDSVLYNTELAEKKSRIFDQLKLEPGNYALATVHRAENTDNANRLRAIFSAFEEISSNYLPVIVPLHPRTKKQLTQYNISLSSTRVIEPVSYLDMLMLEKEAKLIMTDSGGVQKEAYWMRVPCITLRNETEWVETVDSNWNTLTGAETGRIIQAFKSTIWPTNHNAILGDGKTAEAIIKILVNNTK